MVGDGISSFTTTFGYHVDVSSGSTSGLDESISTGGTFDSS